MTAKFVAEEGVLKGLVLNLDQGNEWVIGRDPDACQLILEDPAASRKHALCKATPEGIIVENLSTTNPVQVNNQPIIAPQILHDGDKVKIGSGTFRFSQNGIEDKSAALQESLQEKPFQDDSSSSFHMSDSEEARHDSLYEEESANEKASLAEINFDLKETGRWLLKVVAGPNNGAEFSMQTSKAYLVGTDPNACDIVFHDGSVSRQHARISIGDDDSIMIEDLNSRNGTMIEGQAVSGKQRLNPNAIVTLGTSSFVIYDREGEMQTIISPLLPSIVKVLQEQEAKQKEAEEAARKAQEELALKSREMTPLKKAEKTASPVGAFLLIGIITGVITVIGLGVANLMKSEPIVVQEAVDIDGILKQALAPYPEVKYQFIKPTGNLNLVGHVLTNSNKKELLFSLAGIKFVKNIDDTSLVVDEDVAKEINQVLAKNPNWRGITIQTPTPGHFILTGYLQSRKQAEQIWDYISNNFPFLDILEKRMIVEEEVIIDTNQLLQANGIRDVTPQMSNGELTLNGAVAAGKLAQVNSLIPKLKEIQGVRIVKNFVTEVAPEQTMVNISDRYEVTGVAQKGGINMNVVINGRVLSRGDSLDGMVITSIKPNAVLLERDGVQYRIDYSR